MHVKNTQWLRRWDKASAVAAPISNYKPVTHWGVHTVNDVNVNIDP